MRFKKSPAAFPEGYDCDLSAGEILLVTQILVRGQQNIETGFFRRTQKVSIFELIPSAREPRSPCGARSGIGQAFAACRCRTGQASGAERFRLCAARCELQDGLDLFSRDTKLVHQFVHSHVLKVFEDD